MCSRSDRALRGFIGLIALAVAAPLFGGLPALAWPVGASGDVAIENFTVKSKDGDTFLIPHADFANTNLSKDEIGALLNPDTPEADKRALVTKLKADKIAAPSIEIDAKDGAKIKVHDFLVTDIDGGRVGKFGFSSIDSSATSATSPVSFKSGSLQVEGLDVADLLKAVDGSDGGGKSGRLEHLTWNAIDIVAPDSQNAESKPVHIALGAIELRGGYSGDVLREASTKLSGVVIEPAADSDEGKNLADLGYSKVELAVNVSANYKAEAKTFTLDNFTVDGLQMGSLALKADFSDVPAELLAGDKEARLQALLECGVASLELRLVNAGLFEKALALAAKQQGSTPDALKQQWSAMIGQMAPLFLGGSPSALQAAAETQKFIASPHNLTIALKAKGDALKANDFMAISDPAAFLGKVDISAAANQ
ncbi:MAG TPA: hypothetical protein VGH40_09045 [Roseiarcus sp.]|jgi:hypothetical protein